jgi:outer membrane protein assembly factor BamC
VGDVTIERDGNQRWLVVDRPADKIWDPVRDFWLENGFNMAIEKPELGILETDWAENRAKLPQDIIRSTLGKVFDSLYSTSERDRFRTRLERRADGKTRNLRDAPRHAGGLHQPAKDSTIWQPRAADPSWKPNSCAASWCAWAAPKSSQGRGRRGGTKPTVAQSARVTTLNGQPAVEIDEGFDRAWRRVGVALDRTGFTVEDRDRSKGLYFVRYVANPTRKPRRRASSAACSAQGRSQARQVPDRRAQRRRKSHAVVLGDNGQP